MDTTDARYIAVKESFNLPSSRIILNLPVPPRIASTPATPTPFLNFLGSSTSSPSPAPNPLASTNNVNVEPSAVPADHSAPPGAAWITGGAAGNESLNLRTRRVAVAITGDPNGCPMFVIGGMSGSRFLAWLLHDVALEHGIKIIMPDRPGMGLSEPWDLETYPDASTYANLSSTSSVYAWRGGFQDWAECILQIANELKIDRFAMTGMSCGCVYTLAFAKTYPERLLKGVPLQLLACWIPPSVPECPLFVKSSMILPTIAIVTFLSSTQRLIFDPNNIGVISGVTKFASWITEFSSSSGAFVFGSKKKKKTGDDGESDDDEGSQKQDPGAVLLVRIVMKLNAISYILAKNPTMSPKAAEEAALRMVGFIPPEEPVPPPPKISESISTALGGLRLPGMGKSTPTSSMTSINHNKSVASNFHSTENLLESHGDPITSSPAPVSTMSLSGPSPSPAATTKSNANPPPNWADTDISVELPHLLPYPYTSIGAIDDFLHCIERTGPIGFKYEDIRHDVILRHGAKDTLVPCSSVQAMSKRLKWPLIVYDDEGHDMSKSVIGETFAAVADAVRRSKLKT
ncbi:hypothetical protein HDU97_007384 [Phlyctochytrium planicorne]|nr:hypothetical protein HDU97_007384 [Phlyctochytrium planicorne]